MTKKQITVGEFANAIKNAKIESSHNNMGEDYEVVDLDDTKRWFSHGYACNEIACLGLEIRYNNYYRYADYKPSTVEFYDDYGEHPWQIDGLSAIAIVDEDGEELEEYQIEALVEEHTEITKFDTDFLGEDEYEDPDNDNHTEDDMEQIIVQRDNDKDIRFAGEKIAFATSKKHNSSRWAELTLYRTRGGKYVCKLIGETCWQGETVRHSGEVCDTDEQVVKFFGVGWAAKELYSAAGIDACEDVE